MPLRVARPATSGENPDEIREYGVGEPVRLVVLGTGEAESRGDPVTP